MDTIKVNESDFRRNRARLFCSPSSIFIPCVKGFEEEPLIGFRQFCCSPRRWFLFEARILSRSGERGMADMV